MCCGKILISQTDYRFVLAARCRNPKARLSRIVAICKTRRYCEGCGSLQPLYRKDNMNILVDFSAALQQKNDQDNVAATVAALAASGEEDTKRIFSAEEVLNVFNKISIEDMAILGFDTDHARPTWMIIEALLVPPPCVRPYVQFGTDRSEDDLTLKLLDILKVTKQLRKYEQDGVPNHVLQESLTVLQYHVATLMNNEIPGLPTATTVKSRKPIKSLRERLKGKEGRLRGNLMGKRVDYSARTVITGDPNLAVDQVGIPRSIAMNLTYPEIVTPMNIERLRKLVQNGPSVWPGARYITRADGTRYDLRHCSGGAGGALQIDIGYKVERHMQDGDYILFNRQPSLHKMSIMGHRVKVLPWSTFRCNLSVTTPYNADFDGDEMNLHLAQSEETRSEIKHLCIVHKQIVSPQGNKPVMGIVQDSLLGLAKLTSRDTFLRRTDVMMLLLFISNWNGVLPEPAIYKPEALWTGKQLITTIIKGGATNCTVNLDRDSQIKLKLDNNNLSVNDGRVIIRNGEHLAGVICKKTAGTSSGSLIHVLWHELGGERCSDFITSCQKVANNWLVTQGFTVGICDMMVEDEKVNVRINETLFQCYEKVDELIAMGQNGSLETQPGKSLLESFENRVNQELNQAREISGRIASESIQQGTTRTNNIFDMVNAGSKGSTINISQIIACVGQQNVEGKRIPFGFQNRTLPHFLKFDYGPDSRGFVHNSYLSGLYPHELFFHAMGGREGIIDTACKTSETGYIQRRLVKAMEDVIVAYDRTVRNSNAEIIQFLYGEDAMAGEFIEDQFINVDDLNTLETYYKNKISTDADSNLSRLLMSEWHQILKAYRSLMFQFDENSSGAQYHLPVHLGRLLKITKAKFPNEGVLVAPDVVINAVEDLLQNGFKFLGVGSLNQEAEVNATTLLSVNLRVNLSSRRVIEEIKLGPLGFDWLMKEIKRQFHRALCCPGETVGAIAAQSIGEPATQMTLNTFHFAGVGSKNVTLGVPRLRELINVAKQVKTPSLTVYLKEERHHDAELAKETQGKLEFATFAKVVSSVQIIYDPDPMNTIVKRDRGWVKDYYDFPYEGAADDEDLATKELGRWVVRIHLLERLITEGLSMRQIGQKILEHFSQENLHVIWTDDNHDELVIRIRLNAPMDDEERFLAMFVKHGLLTLPIRGVEGISKVYMREDKITTYDQQSGKFVNAGGRWVLDTDGCNLPLVLAHPDVDFTRTVSNNILEILEVLGVEAARKMLLREIRAVISFDGSYVNYRHLAILCDVMTHRGGLMPITRNGINRVEKGCIAKCSFEETVEILMQAACFGETDYLKGVTENVIVGQLGHFGTGYMDIILNDVKLKDPATHFDVPTYEVQGATSAPQQSLGDFQTSPFSPFSPTLSSPQADALNSPLQVFSPTLQAFASPTQAQYSPTSPTSILNSPTLLSPSLPTMLSPSFASPTQFLSPAQGILSPTMMSARYSPTSPIYSPSSPGFSPTSPASPTYSPMSPIYSPTSPGGAFSPNPASPSYSPTSPQGYSPSSPTYSPVMMSPTYGGEMNAGMSPLANPSSPNFSRAVASPVYSPSSPMFSMAAQNPQSPGAYSPLAQMYSPIGLVQDLAREPTAPLSPTALQSPRYDPIMSPRIQRPPQGSNEKND